MPVTDSRPLAQLHRLMRIAIAVLLLLASTTPSIAADAAPDPELEQMRDRLATRLPEVRREDVQRSAAPGLFEVRSGMTFGYVTADGLYVISGEMADLSTGERITEARRDRERLGIAQRLQPDAIVFAPAAPTQWITVFTDVDCHYCRLLHREVPELNKLGIGIRYVFFSKYGSPSQAYDRARVIWCQKDRQASLNVGLLSGVVPTRDASCKDPVRDQYQAAVDLGIHGTPAMILPDGGLFYGYAKAESIVEEIRSRAAAAAPRGDQPPTAP
ncbi:DsbC family protein [Hydrocarboniphaga sp.]|uniref:DsbC family protein n=1 Tax=Hydrocarboniphaga sp. TaxID=2033016 RepID=UPI00261A5762|nr:DsbC family protein [Hydrocarboniphaga sp.]